MCRRPPTVNLDSTHDYVIDFHTQLSGNIYDMMEGELRELDFGSWKNVDFFDEKTLPCRKHCLWAGS